MSGGKTYSQLSAESAAQPGNTQLAKLVSTVFEGETQRSMLLNAYGWWKVSQITYIISLVVFGLGTASFLGGAYGFARIRRERPGALIFGGLLGAAPQGQQSGAPVAEPVNGAGRQVGTAS
jgi:hypothetical protein